MGRRFYILAVMCTLCLGASSTVLAQRTRPDRGSLDSLLDKVHIQLNPHEREIADDYLDILDELQSLLDDYDSELEDLRNITSKSHDESLKRLRTELEAGRYADDPVQLTDDIETLIRDLKDIENKQKAVENTDSPRTTRVIRNLRRQLVTMIDLIEDYTDTHTQAIFRQRDVQMYLKEAMKQLAEAMDSLDLSDLSLKLKDVNIPIPRSYPVTPALPDVPTGRPPYVIVNPTTPGSSPTLYVGGDVGSTRQIEDSLLTEDNLRVVVTNLSGGVEIIGWNEELIQAELVVEVAASSRTKERNFLNDIALDLKREAGAYRVRAVFPNINDPDTRVLRSQLSVRVPSELALECTSSFGTVTVSDLEGGISLRSQNSEITVDNVSGGVEITNSMGAVTVGEVEGRIKLANSYSPIVVYGCEGDIDINNDYALVKLTDNRGKVVIKNTGQTTIRSHEGDVSIENMYGIVDAIDIDGMLNATNSYSPINVSDITGAVQVSNAYSTISASAIGGLLSISNSHGLIRVSEPESPVRLNSENGDIDLVYSSYSGGGTSQVMLVAGNLRLTLADSPDLRVNVQTSRGMITGTAGIRASSSDGISTAELVYGDGGGKLVISGDKANIFINEE